MSETPSPEPQEPRTATITIVYGSESREMRFTLPEDPWRRWQQTQDLALQVELHLFDMMREKSSDNLAETI